MGRDNDKLNVIKYYGSKAVLCDEIIDRLEYKNCQVYLELFGGGASVLLNKAPHKIEIYNELNLGVYTLFSVLSDEKKGNELIKHLQKVSYAEENFNKALEYRNAVENNPFDEILRKLNKYIKKIEKNYNLSLYKKYKESDAENDVIEARLQKRKINFSEDVEGKRLLAEYFWLADEFYKEDGEVLLKELNDCIKSYKKKYKEKLAELETIDTSDNSIDSIDTDFTKRKTITYKRAERVKHIRKIKSIIAEYGDADEKKEIRDLEKKYTDMIKRQKNCEKRKKDYDEIELAKATFIIYNMSRDGIGKDFSNLDDGQRRFDGKVNGLPDVIKRLNNVTVLNESVFDMLDRKKLEQALLEKGVDIKDIPNEQMMYYLDPPYLEDASVTENRRQQKSGNPGKVYKCVFNIKQHEDFLKKICSRKEKMLVSNYRDKNKTYDTYLSADAGWKYTEFETKTSVGGNGGDRTEILWQNY